MFFRNNEFEHSLSKPQVNYRLHHKKYFQVIGFEGEKQLTN
ncbi:hypothetical protein PFLA_a1663 [Pseudoalteromonas flavipulchra NCIMB 2033 = ATCC BAA-314]|nr:hypothetical protein [Pseudoalteromonas flavipulchra NCIMB 2033 = ATCC BAA-314]